MPKLPPFQWEWGSIGKKCTFVPTFIPEKGVFLQKQADRRDVPGFMTVLKMIWTSKIHVFLIYCTKLLTWQQVLNQKFVNGIF